MSAQQQEYKPADHADGGEFDYIIVGGGTAGSLLANRLSADLQR